jgi:hypothetical protein
VRISLDETARYRFTRMAHDRRYPHGAVPDRNRPYPLVACLESASGLRRRVSTLSGLIEIRSGLI